MDAASRSTPGETDAGPGIDLAALLASPRAEWRTRLMEIVPTAAGAGGSGAAGQAAMPGGRTAALERLAAIDPRAYARSRNHVEGAVSRLSPWIRHGVLSLAEVRDVALARVERPEDAEKFVSELGWRDYWRRVQAALGDRIRTAIEPPARTARRGPPLDAPPPDVLEARTGMACIDAFVRRLHATGWLHNHERMWLASWLVHVRGVDWRACADWFLAHLLDGDPASNHLSWQWVAGTFSAKPYLFNRENLETYTSGRHCRGCPLLGRCDVEGSYEALDARLFAPGAAARPPLRIRPAAPWGPAGGASRRPLVWLTLDSAAATSPASAAHPDAPRLFVIDRQWLATERPALGRLAFLCECLAEVPGLEVRVGDAATIVPARAAALGCDAVAVADSPCPLVRRTAATVAAALPVEVWPWPPFCDASRVDDLGRFSRYWQRVSRSALRPTAA
jgi:deoxyribodipyrimidine photo-lyase